MTCKYKALLIAGISTALPVTAAIAGPTVRTSANVSGGLAYEHNPFLVDDNNADAASVQLELTPRLEILDVREAATISAYYRRSEYLSKYDSTDAAAVSVDGSAQLSSRLSLGTSIRFDSSILGGNNDLPFNRGLNQIGLYTPPNADVVGGSTVGGSSGGVVTSVPSPTLLATDAGLLEGDLGLIGTRQRRNLFSTGLTASYRPGPRGTWTFGLNADRTWYPGDGRIAEPFHSAGAFFGYSLASSETTTLGARITASQVDYDQGRKTRIYSPQATFSKRLLRGWSLDLAAGASFIKSNDLASGFGSDDGTSLNIQADFCRAGARSRLCLTLTRTPSTSGLSGVNTASTAQLSHNIRLNVRSSFATFVSVSRNESDQRATFAGTNQTFIVAGSSYNRQLSQRFSVTASAQYRDVRYAQRSIQPDLSARVGISTFFGKIK